MAPQVINRRTNMNSTKAVSIFTSMLWATAIVASEFLKAPPFLTSILLPLLGFASLAIILTIGRNPGVAGVDNSSVFLRREAASKGVRC
jgi:hypothetical protein